MVDFQEIKAGELQDNIINLISKDWMLITAGDERACNTMTASWGMMGHLWGKDVATIFIRPQRYTRRFVDNESGYTLSFLDNRYRKALAYCGSRTGATENKIDNAGLSTILTPGGVPAIAESRLILECRKLYVDKIKPESFLDSAIIDEQYPESDYHYVYVGEITRVYTK